MFSTRAFPEETQVSTHIQPERSPVEIIYLHRALSASLDSKETVRCLGLHKTPRKPYRQDYLEAFKPGTNILRARLDSQGSLG